MGHISRKFKYLVDVQCKTIHARGLLHNLIIQEMALSPICEEGEGGLSELMGMNADHIKFVETTNAWT